MSSKLRLALAAALAASALAACKDKIVDPNPPPPVVVVTQTVTQTQGGGGPSSSPAPGGACPAATSVGTDASNPTTGQRGVTAAATGTVLDLNATPKTNGKGRIELGRSDCDEQSPVTWSATPGVCELQGDVQSYNPRLKLTGASGSLCVVVVQVRDVADGALKAGALTVSVL